jgi:hypothetical protein
MGTLSIRIKGFLSLTQIGMGHCVISVLSYGVRLKISTVKLCIHHSFGQKTHSDPYQSVSKTESLQRTFNPFSGRFIIASHIYMGEFPLPPAGI